MCMHRDIGQALPSYFWVAVVNDIDRQFIAAEYLMEGHVMFHQSKVPSWTMVLMSGASSLVRPLGDWQYVLTQASKFAKTWNAKILLFLCFVGEWSGELSAELSAELNYVRITHTSAQLGLHACMHAWTNKCVVFAMMHIRIDRYLVSHFCDSLRTFA